MTTRPDTILPPEPEVSSGSLSIEIIEREQVRPVIDREELALRVIGHVDAINVKLAELKPYIERLWSEFENLPDGETIAGCYTKAEFCEKRLRRTPRAVRYMLAGALTLEDVTEPEARSLLDHLASLRPAPSKSEIPYIPDFLSADEADRLFEVCKQQESQRLVNERNPGSFIRRLQMPCYSATPAFRGSRNEKTNPWMRLLDEAPAELKNLAARLTELAGKRINYISLVGYENEKDHIVWHQHREDDCRDARVFILSLGETRTFGVRPVCPEGVLYAKCNDDACRDGENSCDLCQSARQHRKTCSKCKDRKNWTLLQPAHGSLITLPHEWNKTHEHAVLDDEEPKGLRISINTKHITAEDIAYFDRLEQETTSRSHSFWQNGSRPLHEGAV